MPTLFDKLSGFFVVVAVSILSIPCPASEADVHYGLTHWLARKAGFTAQAADAIAKADLGRDGGTYDPAPWAVAHILLTGEAGASEDVRDQHFPSGAEIPSSPEERRVEPNSVYARKFAESVLKYDPKISDHNWLEDLGKSLHPLQDSWAHQGTPDIPFGPWAPRFRSDLSWGHPCDRGGWLSYDADLTFLHVDETETMAYEVWQILLKARTARPSLAPGPVGNWNSMKGEIEKFAKASSKAEKIDWFRSSPEIPYEEYSERESFSSIDLITEGKDTRGSTPCGSLPKSWKPQWFSAATLIRSFTSLFRRSHLSYSDLQVAQNDLDLFLQRWLVEQDLRKAVGSIDERRFFGPYLRLPQQVAHDRVEITLGLWLLRDHGLANSMMHGEYSSFPPATDTTTQYAIKSIASQEARFKYDSVKTAIEPPTVNLQDVSGRFHAGKDLIVRSIEPNYILDNYLLTYVGGHDASRLTGRHFSGPVCIVTFDFKQLPYDKMFLMLGKSKGRWKVQQLHGVAL
jgi:hypothetical protein